MNALLEIDPSSFLKNQFTSASTTACKDNYLDLSDEDLMSHIVEGCTIAFTTLMSRHLKKVKSIATKIIYSGADADDATQEVFINIWKNRQTWRNWRSSFSTWLYRITLHKCIDLNKKVNFCQLDPTHEPVDEAPNALSRIYTVEFNHALSKAINSLSMGQRIAVLLHYHEGLSAQECAKVLKMNATAVEGLLKRARQKLKDLLGQSDMIDFKVDSVRHINLKTS